VSPDVSMVSRLLVNTADVTGGKPTGFYLRCHHHHQPINVPTAGAQAFLIDYT
jgi:hypothetical protein